jgi:alginate O-acetyltransferase complex protein AlgI
VLFNSYGFIFLFLPIVVLVYQSLVSLGNRRVALSWLVGASLFFYAWWNPAYLGLIIGSMLFNYSIGMLLVRKPNKSLLVLGVAVNLGLLGYYKYANFFIDNMANLTGADWNLEHIVLPLAISFFTFQQITYLVDTYRGETREYSFLQYALFVTFFPQLIAGPIVHHREMMPQFASFKPQRINYQMMAVGLSIFFLGLFKKVVIADSLSPYANEAFAVVQNGDLLTFFEAWRGTLAYSFQLYFDFSGYSDMAIGLAGLFCIRLPINFNSPYQAYSIIDFWQRWHITLSRFLRDYLYIALGGNRKGTLRRYVNLIVTMLLGGLWHGAGWTFVIWGGLHGIYLVVNHGWRTINKTLGLLNDKRMTVRFVSRLLTFFAVVIGWVFFRASDLPSAMLMLDSLFGAGGVVWPEDERAQLGALANIFSELGLQFAYVEQFNGFGHISTMLVMLLIVWYAPNVQQIMSRYPLALSEPFVGRIKWQPNWRWCVWIGLLAIVSILKLGEVSEFLYFQF